MNSIMTNMNSIKITVIKLVNSIKITSVRLSFCFFKKSLGAILTVLKGKGTNTKKNTYLLIIPEIIYKSTNFSIEFPMVDLEKIDFQQHFKFIVEQFKFLVNIAKNICEKFDPSTIRKKKIDLIINNLVNRLIKFLLILIVYIILKIFFNKKNNKKKSDS